MSKLLGCLLLLIVFLPSVARSENTARVILTWRAANYFPPYFQGKAEATLKTRLAISAEAITKNKFLDLGKALFTWYVDDKALATGLGKKEIELPIRKPAGESYLVRVIIKLGEMIGQSQVNIPITQKKVVIDAPYPKNLIRAGDETRIYSIPYFFNVTSTKDLDFTWEIDKETQILSGEGQLVFRPPQNPAKTPSTINVGSAVANKKDSSESRKSEISFTVH